MGIDGMFYSIYDLWHIDDRQLLLRIDFDWIFAVRPLSKSDAQNQKI